MDKTVSSKKLSVSPDRFSHQQNSYLARKAKEGQTPDNNEDVAAMVDYFNQAKQITEESEADPTWEENNLEYDLRATEWILEKVRFSEEYAQNLYAALCNNSFIKQELWPVLKDQQWSCTWRYAGGIVADMRQEGDYLNWYCSGIGDDTQNYVAESVVTNEIRADLLKLGWAVVDNDQEVDF